MKHTARILSLMILMFFCAQVIGLWIVNQYIDHPGSQITQETEWKPLPYNIEEPQIENESFSFIPIIIALLLGTALLLIIIKLNAPIILKIWFFLVVVITLSLALAAFLPSIVAMICALVLAFLKVVRKNVLVHNVTELFIYGGLAVLLIRILNWQSALVLLVAISVYDMIAVWKTKHMVKMAEFQHEAKLFAGLYLPYAKGGSLKPSAHSRKVKGKIAVLGGGDVGFPLLFASTLLEDAVLEHGIFLGYLQTLIIPLCVTVALFLLLFYGKNDRFYPAMPFLTLGCFVGFLIFLLI